jgi:hypothetical protein
MTLPLPNLRFVRASVAMAGMLLAMTGQAAEAKFINDLSPQEKADVGVAKLTPSQAGALDGLVAHDARLARQGGVTGFSSTFLARLSPSQRDSAGIDRLSEKEQAALNTFVARTIALGPPPDQAYTYSPPEKPSPPPPPPPTLVSTPLHAEVHGDVSFTVGGGSHGSSFYGTSTDLNVTDPTGKFTVGIGFEQFRGKGLIGLYGPNSPYYYGPVGPPYLAPYWGP